MDAGLEKVIAAETVLSKVDGLNGRLIIRGYDVGALAGMFTFEDMLHLLWSGFFEGLPNVDTLRERLVSSRQRAFVRLEPLFPYMAERPSMEGLRLALSACADGDDVDTAMDVIATLTVGAAATARLRGGFDAIAPNPDLSHTDDFLFMLSGACPGPEMSKGMAAYFNTVSEHGLNASTFAARVVASTQAGLTSAAIAGFSALKGPLHGGAPGPVLDMLDGIGNPENAEAWIRDALDRKDRLMGFGHRVYKVRDPRADALKQAVSKLPKSSGRLVLAEAIERVILDRLATEKPDRNLETNVEYYTAVLLEALGVDREDFTCVFACARAAGWLAHAREQLGTRRIIRPKAVYVGPDAEGFSLSA